MILKAGWENDNAFGLPNEGRSRWNYLTLATGLSLIFLVFITRQIYSKVARRPRPPKEACVMSEMTELIVLLMSPIVAFTSFLFVDELRRSRNSSAD
jgi:hypothetical protein